MKCPMSNYGNGSQPDDCRLDCAWLVREGPCYSFDGDKPVPKSTRYVCGIIKICNGHVDAANHVFGPYDGGSR